jgi:hypothetical protein
MNGEDINVSSQLHAVVQDRNLHFSAYRLQMAKYREKKTSYLTLLMTILLLVFFREPPAHR